MRRLAGSLLAAPGLVLAAGCLWPTEACGCTPPRAAVVVLGTVTDAAGQPLTGTRVHLEGVAPGDSALPPRLGWVSATTDAAGAFATRAHARGAPGEYVVSAAMVRAGGADTVWRSGGVARFRSDFGPLDTVRVTLRFP